MIRRRNENVCAIFGGKSVLFKFFTWQFCKKMFFAFYAALNQHFRFLGTLKMTENQVLVCPVGVGAELLARRCVKPFVSFFIEKHSLVSLSAKLLMPDDHNSHYHYNPYSGIVNAFCSFPEKLSNNLSNVSYGTDSNCWKGLILAHRTVAQT